MTKTAFCERQARGGTRHITKTLLVMKLTVFLLTGLFLNVQATGVSQNISFSGNNLPVETVLDAVEKQTGFVFAYEMGLLKDATPVTIQAEKMPLDQFLKLLFRDQPFTFVIRNQTVIVSRNRIPPSNRQLNISDLLDIVPPIKISGTITGLNKNPVMGASVVIKGTNRGTVSDATGKFSLNAEVGDKLVISFIGYEKYEITVEKNKTYSIQLTPGSSLIDSFTISSSVNTGYQRIRPEQSTGAVSKITTKDYESRISTDFLSGLVNKLPGLMINSDVQFNSNINGVTSSNSLFNVRGISTISGNQSPLIVIDGYPTELTLDMINPNEIESVTILKDAAAATVYGVRASNGVIVIERKKALSGKTRFTLRSTTSIRPKEDYTRYNWAPDGSAVNIAYNRNVYKTSVNANSWTNLLKATGAAFPPVYYLMALQASSGITAEQADSKFQEMAGYNNAADYSRLLLRNAVNQTYNLNISGGSPGALYYITANYTGNRLQQINNNTNQIMLSGRTNLSLSKNLSLELITDYLENRTRKTPVPALNTIYPYEKLQDDYGNPLPITNGSLINPYYNNVLMAQGYYDQLYYPLVNINEITDKTRTANYRVTTNFIYKLGKGFNFQFGGIYESSITDLKHYATEKSSQPRQYVNYYTQVDASGKLVYNVPRGGFLQQQGSATTGYTLRARLNYDKQISKNHSLNVLLGAEVRDVIDELSSAAYFGYNDESLLQQPVNYGNIATGYSNASLPAAAINYNSLFNRQYVENRYLSGFTNAVYSYRNTYSVSASVRIDQSNLFGSDPKYRYKPLWSVGTAWNIHKEAFMQDLSWIKMLKLRLAYGFNGNVAKNSLPVVIAKAITNSYTIPLSTALTRSSFANSSLRWEQTNTINTGLDFSIFRGITGSIEYYNKRSTDLLSNTPIDPTLGKGPTYMNIASINNHGLELNLRADWITTPRFNWNTGLVLARNTSKVLDVYQNLGVSPISRNGSGYLKDYPLGPLFAFRWAGLSNTGVPQIRDEKGTVISTTASNITQIMVIPPATSGIGQYMGTTIPPINVGLSNRVDVGNFYIYCMINYYGGFKTFIPRANPADLHPLAGAGNYWKQPGDELNTDVMSLSAFTLSNPKYAYQYADTYVVDGDYLTIGDITASYNFGNSRFFKKAGISMFELKVQASNVYTVGFNKFNYSKAMGSYEKSYITPNYTIALFTNF